MIAVQENIDLLPFNTFKIKANARYFTVVTSVREAKDLFKSDVFRQNKSLILGGGSNLLLTKDFDGLVIKNEIKGIDIVDENDDVITLRVGAGENWHEFVMYCVSRDLGGVENLSLIPGTVGAAPMQNIGAYGVEIKEVIHNVEAIELSTGAIHVFNRAECAFGYRESVFKQQLKDRYFISSITLTLTKRNHRFNTSYGAITDVLKEKNVRDLSVKAISDAIIFIRKSKLPDPVLIGNAGSFFKNPSVDPHVFEALKKNFPAIPSFPGENNLIKIPAGWLIEQCGWKGKTLENIGVHKHQALVLVNYGGGDGKKIQQLSRDIQASVEAKFNIKLHAEVNII
ncbi:UDP-N-acetylmuramate dehydrogenase [Chryseosolibacter histidini]|uniref:UDP-N-acetylmuramate dehydrogenase n=1 Tax=Chryseosolibacter histidini TaxID=2782349 RepID=UPI0021D4717B|nr:UDP-N-acetylmuramate dehydrogenase [Chryseosolibacter histidini]